MLDLIMKLLGYENINKIKIPENYKRPREIKLQAKRHFYRKYGVLPESRWILQLLNSKSMEPKICKS